MWDNFLKFINDSYDIIIGELRIWLNHKYVDSNNYEIVDNVFEVDEGIADTISILNKLGYYTKYCCSGHVKDSRKYEMYINKSKEDFDEGIIENGYIVREYGDRFDILLPYTFTAVYIMFLEDYDFPMLPDGFVRNEDNVIEMIIDYYDNGIRKSSLAIENEIRDANKRLYEWAKSLDSVEN